MPCNAKQSVKRQTLLSRTIKIFFNKHSEFLNIPKIPGQIFITQKHFMEFSSQQNPKFVNVKPRSTPLVSSIQFDWFCVSIRQDMTRTGSILEESAVYFIIYFLVRCAKLSGTKSRTRQKRLFASIQFRFVSCFVAIFRQTLRNACGGAHLM